MAYTPELTYENACTLRRIAWASGIPMTVAINELVNAMAEQLEPANVCSRCRDKSKCNECKFNRQERKGDAHVSG